MCNYVYYSSLVYTAARDAEAALFCHVPPFSVIKEDDQIKFAVALMREIAAVVCRTRGSHLEGVPAPLVAPVLLPPDMLESLGLVLSLREHLGEPELKMVVLVNMELKMRPGKVASQACHAVLKAHRRLEKTNPPLLRQWRNGGEPIVVLKCPSYDEMKAIRCGCGWGSFWCVARRVFTVCVCGAVRRGDVATLVLLHAASRPKKCLCQRRASVTRGARKSKWAPEL